MVRVIMLCSVVLAASPAMAEDCTPEATRDLGSLMSRVTEASKAVDSYNQKHKINSQDRTDLLMFCLDAKSRPEFQQLFKEAAPAVNNLEEFGNRQTGPCKESALKASKDLEDNVRKIMAKFEKCKQGQK